MVYCHFVVACLLGCLLGMTQRSLQLWTSKGNAKTQKQKPWVLGSDCRHRYFPYLSLNPAGIPQLPLHFLYFCPLYLSYSVCLPCPWAFLPLCKRLSCSVFYPASSVLALLFEVSFFCISAGQVFYVLENHKGSYRGKGDCILKTR